MSANVVAAAQLFLPGIEGNQFVTSYNLEPQRWYVCSCQTLNCVENCRNPTSQSILPNCGVALAVVQHEPRDGVRRATLQDFASPVGIHMARTPPAIRLRSEKSFTSHHSFDCQFKNQLLNDGKMKIVVH